MKRLFIAILATLVFAAALAAAIAYDPGYVLIAFGRYTLETTVWVGVALLLVTLLAMYLFVFLLHSGVRQGNVFSRWRANWSDRRSRQLTQRGLLAFLEGNFERARVVLDRAASGAEHPAINYLLAARAAVAHGDAKLGELYLLRAQRSDDEVELAVALTRAELLAQSGQWRESLDILQGIPGGAAKHPHVLKLLLDTYSALRDWPNVLQLLPQLRRKKMLSPEQCAELELSATVNLLDELAGKRQLENLRTHWRQLSRALERDPRVVMSYARGLAALGAEAEAELVLRQRLQRDWNRELGLLYGRVAGADPARQLAVLEQWLQQRGSNAALLLSAGRVALRNQLWGKARDYLEASLKLEDNAEACAELARLLAKLGQHERSGEYYERSLAATTFANTTSALPQQR